MAHGDPTQGDAGDDSGFYTHGGAIATHGPPATQSLNSIEILQKSLWSR
jgi:hypothetical protein